MVKSWPITLRYSNGTSSRFEYHATVPRALQAAYNMTVYHAGVPQEIKENGNIVMTAEEVQRFVQDMIANTETDVDPNFDPTKKPSVLLWYQPTSKAAIPSRHSFRYPSISQAIEAAIKMDQEGYFEPIHITDDKNTCVLINNAELQENIILAKDPNYDFEAIENTKQAQLEAIPGYGTF